MFQKVSGYNWIKEWWLQKRIIKDDKSMNIPHQKMPKESVRKCTLTSFLNSLPKLESHYCRTSFNKIFLELLFQSMADMSHCKDKSETSFTRPVFAKEFSHLNMSIFRPRKFLCDTCIGYSEKHVDEFAHARHIKKKHRAQQDKILDKQSTIYEKCKFITVDLQALLLCLMLKVSAIYYRTKLCVHNFTIFELSSYDVVCYVWHE